MNKKITGGVVAFLTIVGAPFLMASQCDTQASGPDPVPAAIKPVKILSAYQLPEGFRNVVQFCDDFGNLVSVTSRGSDFAGGQNGGGLPSSISVLPSTRCAK